MNARLQRRRRNTALLLLVLPAVLAGCGKRGSPLPPQPRGPLAPREVSARQLGDQALVALRVPEARGPRPSAQPVRAELVRVAYAPGLAPPSDPDAFRRRGDIVGAKAEDSLPSGERIVIEDRRLADLPDGGIGWTLRYAVRVRDRKGRPSPLVVAADLVPGPPPLAPSGLKAEPTSDGVRLVWELDPAEQEQAFNVYRREFGQELPDEPLNALPVTGAAYLDSEVVTGKHYLYSLRRSLAAGRPFREGTPGSEFAVRAEDRFAPAAPRSLVVVQEGRAARLFWNPNQERDVAGYRLYRRVGQASWQRVGGERIVRPLYLDTEVEIGPPVSYRVSAIDRAQPPNESDCSGVVVIAMVEDPAGQGP